MLTPKELANKLINYRIKNNLYQKALGKEIGISIKTVVSLEKERKVTLKLTIDTKICPVLDYFEIFMKRTMMCKYAAKYLKIWFELIINDTRLL